MAKPKFTAEEAQTLRRQYEAGETTTALAREHGVGDCCIAAWVRRAGGEIRTNSESKRKYVFDEGFFERIDTERKAYWLGFFLADGYIGKYGGKWRNFWCTLSAKDADHLAKFLDHIGATYKVATHTREGHKKCRICLTSVPFVDNLISMGWLSFKKHGDTDILRHIPKALLCHFVRGFFDGDGSVMRYARKDRPSDAFSVVIVAPFEHQQFLDAIRQTIVAECGVADKTMKRGKSVYRCHWNGNRQIARIGHWLYNNATIYMERKKRRFDAITEDVSFVWPGDNHFRCSHSPKQIADMSEDRRNHIISKFCGLAINSNWVPPRYPQPELLADWRSARIYDNDLYRVREDEKLVGFRLNTGGSSESPGKKIVLHFQPHFWAVKTSGPPITKQWNNASVVRRAARALLTTGNSITLKRYIRELRYAGVGVTSHFHPNFAAAIVQSVAPNAKSWFDPCMGWGGRLMAAKLMDMEYEGCEPQPDTLAGLEAIKRFIGSGAVLRSCKIQDYAFTKEFDLAFTSPPFFNKEKYGGQEQSYEEFGKFDVWLTQFLCPMIDRLLERCRKVVLHVDERIREPLSKLYQFTTYPLYLQRNPGGPTSVEAVVVF